MRKRFVFVLIVLIARAVVGHAAEKAQMGFTNSLGMKLIRIEPGTFMMGIEKTPLPPESTVYDRPGWYRGEPKPPALWDGVRAGLVGAIFNDGDQNENRMTRVIEQVNLDWSSEQARKDRLWGKSTRWRGLVKAPSTGIVTFTVEANDEVRVLINHEVVIDAAGKNNLETARVQMIEGKYAQIAIDTENTSYTRLYWNWAGRSKELVPPDAFSHSAEDYNMVLAYGAWAPGRKGGRGVESIGDYDEQPRHEVTITQPFYISETEVTIDQFRQFQAEYPGYDKFRPYASAISWNEAVAFCKWLSKKEGKPYRLPTEAEWEYACRAGTETPFSSGNTCPEHETANAWGLKNMHTGVREWCLDWHGVYPEEAQTDPVGPADGWVKIIRGGAIDWSVGDNPYFARSSNRGAAAPSFGPPPVQYQFKQLQNAKLKFKLPQQLMEEAHRQYQIERLDDTNVTMSEALNTPFRYTGLAYRWSIRTSGFIPGRHSIGFRVVQAPSPESKPPSFEPPFFHRCVKQTNQGVTQGPDPDKPYYRTRLIFPNIGHSSLAEVGWKIGLEKGYGGGHHNSALCVLPNGDLVAAYYNTIFGGERDPGVSIMTMRLRHGANEWDNPSGWPDNVDSDDEGPVIWNDNGIIWFFWGSPRQEAGYPFQWTRSKDNGATWEPIHFPLFDARVGPYAAQPINSAFRDSNGTIYLAVDGSHSPISSELFASKDNGRTWYDTGGRTFGRHSTFVVLDNDVIMGFAGKQASIDGWHPINISRDGGASYEITASALPALGGGTRASVIKLASGRLLYVADMQPEKHITREMLPPGYTGRGAYAAVSDDGQTWRIRKLVGGNVLDKEGKPVDVHTVSYVTARQGRDGMIHAVTSHNHPDLHFEFNEAWILQGDTEAEPLGSKPAKILPHSVKEYREEYSNGQAKVTWSAGIAEDGHHVLHGKETWYYENGRKQWEASYDAGDKKGTEGYWSADGKPSWQKAHYDNGTTDVFMWDPEGNIKALSRWQGKKLLRYRLRD